LKRIYFLICLAILVYQQGFSQSAKEEMKKELKAPWFVEKYRASIGGFIPVSNTNLQVSATGANHTIGTDIDFEDDLGFNRTSETFLADFQYSLTRRSRFDLSYTQLNRTATKTLQKDIIFDEDTFHVNNQTAAFFNTGIYRFSYGYSIITNTKFEIGLLFGFHILHANAGLSSVGNSANLALSKDFGFTAPLPDFGIWGGYAFSDRWSVNGEFDYFSIKIGDIKGEIVGAQLGVTFRAYKKLDIIAGYSGFHFNVNVSKPHAYGSLSWGYSGPSLAVSYSFGKKGWSSN